jgi:hypothetical protein
MNKKLVFTILSIFVLLFLVSCPPDYNIDNEEIIYHYVHYQNNSSHNFIIQYFLNSDWYNYTRPEGNVYFINVDEHPRSSNLTVTFYMGYNQFTRAIIVDTDTHKELRKIEMNQVSFLNMLKNETQYEKEQYTTEVGQRITTYNYFFDITDSFLNEK